MRAAFIHSLADGTSRPLTDGMADVRHPRFDRGGQYLYLTASIDIGPANSMGDLSQMRRPVTRSAYVVVLRADGASPLAPESDEEKEPEQGRRDGPRQGREATGRRRKTKEKDKEKTQRSRWTCASTGPVFAIASCPFPCPHGTTRPWRPGRRESLFLVEEPVVTLEAGPEGPPLTVHRFSFESRKAEKVLDEITAFVVLRERREGSRAQGVRLRDRFPGGPGPGGEAAKPPARRSRR